MPYTIRHNARTAHLEGIAERTHTGTEFDNSETTGVVTYYAQSACAALTRSGHRMAAADEVDTLADALDALRYFAEVRGLKVCANCEKAAVAALESAYNIAELEARSAYGQLDAATSNGNESRIADLEARAERAADKYADLADIIGRCRIFGCEAPTHETSAWCQAHTDDGGADDTASAVETKGAPGVVAMIADRTADYPRGPVALPDHGWKPAPSIDPAVAAAGRASTVGKAYTPEPMARGCLARITHNAIGAACIRTGKHNAHRTADGIEWMPGQTRPLHCPYDRTPAGCEDCKEHGELVNRVMESGKATTYAAAEALAVAMEEEPEAFVPLAPDPVAVYNARRALYRTAADGYEEHGGEANRAAAAAAWDAFMAAARAAGKCTDFTCYADAEPGADRCQRHHQRVTAHLDHTEPGKAIALIEGGHRFEAAPQAWLSYVGGSWTLVDDYDGETFTVKGPDAERAVRAWAVLRGVAIDELTARVEYGDALGDVFDVGGVVVHSYTYDGPDA
jgi:hypothetical protein